VPWKNRACQLWCHSPQSQSQQVASRDVTLLTANQSTWPVMTSLSSQPITASSQSWRHYPHRQSQHVASRDVTLLTANHSTWPAVTSLVTANHSMRLRTYNVNYDVYCMRFRSALFHTAHLLRSYMTWRIRAYINMSLNIHFMVTSSCQLIFFLDFCFHLKAKVMKITGGGM